VGVRQLTWSRLDDGWTDSPVLAALSYETRWHYLAMIQFCSRTGRYDGVVPARDALRCSDVPDPHRCIEDLVAQELVVTRDVTYRVTRIDDHVPPPHLRDEKRKKDAAERKRKSRLHQRGDHTYCSHPLEDVTREVTRDVTRDVGTGQDGTGQDGSYGEEPPDRDEGARWPAVRAVPVLDRGDEDEVEWSPEPRRRARCRVCDEELDPVLGDDVHPGCAAA
jgi:hypothetical protein